jgi:DNA repair exonuclease SbcCD ATPase subunit
VIASQQFIGASRTFDERTKLVDRIERLRQEIAESEAKHRGIGMAIDTRKRVLARLEAQLILVDDSAPARVPAACF